MSKRHIHYDIIIAYAEGKEIEQKLHDGTWTTVTNPGWFSGSQYRIKPKLVPFTYKDADKLIGRTVRSKDGSVHAVISYMADVAKGVTFMTNVVISYSDLLERYEFRDGSPCGNLK